MTPVDDIHKFDRNTVFHTKPYHYPLDGVSQPRQPRLGDNNGPGGQFHRTQPEHVTLSAGKRC